MDTRSAQVIFEPLHAALADAVATARRVESVLREISDLGWSVPETKNGKKILDKLIVDGNEERWPGYTERTADLVTQIWPQGELPCRLLSGVVHAGLYGLNRNLAVLPSGRSVMRPDPAGAAIWLWQDIYLVAGALLLTTDRAVSFLGLREHAAQLHALVGNLQSTLVVLRPAAL